LRTDDGGETWKDLETGLASNLFGVDVASRNDVLAVGEQGSIINSKDGGVTWELQPSITNTSLFSIAYRGGENVWVAGRGGAILRRVEPVATVSIPVSKLPPLLKGGSVKLEQVVDDTDIPPAERPKKPVRP
jgi:photosystem II stability/assembly factor-like uncharacterized protein